MDCIWVACSLVSTFNIIIHFHFCFRHRISESIQNVQMFKCSVSVNLKACFNHTYFMYFEWASHFLSAQHVICIACLNLTFDFKWREKIYLNKNYSMQSIKCVFRFDYIITKNVWWFWHWWVFCFKISERKQKQKYRPFGDQTIFVMQLQSIMRACKSIYYLLIIVIHIFCVLVEHMYVCYSTSTYWTWCLW